MLGDFKSALPAYFTKKNKSRRRAGCTGKTGYGTSYRVSKNILYGIEEAAPLERTR